MTMEIKKATRKAIPAIICFYGRSGGGKTYSALRLAQGLVDGDRICVIDTENGRASHYADEFDFDVIDLMPPFTPARYMEAIGVAQKAGYKAIIIDSISHEWDGTGGCCEMNDGKGLGGWLKPKAEHKKLMNLILQSKTHIIFCARAKDDLEQVKINGKTEIINRGIVPIQEKNFPFEMLITFRMDGKGKVFVEKCVKSLEGALKIDEFITEEHGKAISAWVNKGEKIDLEVKQLKQEAGDIAMNGTLALTSWFANLDTEKQIIAKRFEHVFKKELSKIAKDADSDNSKTANLESLKFANGEPLVKPEVQAEPIEEIEGEETPRVKAEEIATKHESAIKSYKNEKSLLAHFNYLETKSDMEFLKDNAGDLHAHIEYLKGQQLNKIKGE